MSKLIYSNKKLEKFLKDVPFMTPWWSPQKNLFRLYDAYLNNIMENFDESSNNASNIYSNEKEYIIEYAKSGIPLEKWDIWLQDQKTLSISAEYNEEKAEDVEYYKKSFYSYKINDKIQLPDDVDVDNIEASYKDGILKIKIPRKQLLEFSGKQIQVNKE